MNPFFHFATLGILLLASCSQKPAPVDSSVSSVLTYADSVNSGWIAVDSIKKSTPRFTQETIGDGQIGITYFSPGVRGRTIWGELVPFDKIWAAGAHRATVISFQSDVEIENVEIPAGKYAFFAIPGRAGWTLILNKNFDQHMADNYSEADDMVRFNVIPDTLQVPVQRLTYSIKVENSSAEDSHHATDRAVAAHTSSGVITMNWEKIGISFPVKVAVQ